MRALLALGGPRSAMHSFQESTMKSRAQVIFLSLASAVLVWAILHYLLRDTLIYHDAWKHVFPLTYGIALSGSCGTFAYWLNSPDTGSETVIYALNASLTHPSRAVLMALWSCTRPTPFDAMMFYEFQIFVTYGVFVLGMFVLGRIIFRHWLTPIYLVAASLFAGLAVQVVHSDQYSMLVFWMPWCAAAGTLAHRHAGSLRGAFYIALMTAFFCLALNDQEPHAAAFAGGCALMVYCAFNFPKVRLFVTRWIYLWPVVVLFGACLAGFFVIKSRIFDYLPAQHSDILTHPTTMGETGFVQPGTFLAALFPLSFTASAEEIRQGDFWRAYNFQLDVVVFYIGTLPLLLLLSLFPRGGVRGAALGWTVFSLVMLLVSMQKTLLYYLIFHLPFFDIFRNYFFYFVYAVVGILILSGYGLERLIVVSRVERQRILRSTLDLALPLFAIGATVIAIQKQPGAVVAVLSFVGVYSFLSIASGRAFEIDRSYGGGPIIAKLRRKSLWVAVFSIIAIVALPILLRETGWLHYWKAMAADAAILGVSFATIGWSARRLEFGAVQGLMLIAALVATQSFFVIGAYAFIGEPARVIFDRYQMSAELLTPYSAEELAAPTSLRRVFCPTHGACFLAQRDAASLKTDLDGTWLRLKQNPVFRDDLSPQAKRGVLAQPILWASARLKPLPSVAALDAVVEASQMDLSMLLRQNTFVIGKSLTAQQQLDGTSDIQFSQWSATPDRISFRYQAVAPGVVNLNIAYSPYWKVTVRDSPATVISGNYGTIAIPVQPGEGVIALVYDDLLSWLYFWSRWLMAVIGILGMIVIAREVSLFEEADSSRRAARAR